jgi:hypothetical protein
LASSYGTCRSERTRWQAALCAREEVTYAPEGREDIIAVTAADIFG